MMGNELTVKEMNELISLAQRVVWSSPDIRKKIQNHGVNIVPANFYSDIPTITEIENSFEYQSSNLEVYNSRLFNRDTINQFIDKISIYSDEFSVPEDGNEDDPSGYFWNNSQFSYADAMSYYCILRYLKPKRILEVGSGFSTLVADKAMKKMVLEKLH